MQAQVTKTVRHANGRKPVNLKPEAEAIKHKVEPVDELTLGQKLHAAHQKLIDEHFASIGRPVPSWIRVAAMYISSAAIGAGIGVLFNLVDAMLLTSLMSTSVALYWGVWLLGMLCTLVLAYKAGVAIGDYVMSGKVDAHAKAAKDKVVGWFARTPKLAAA